MSVDLVYVRETRNQPGPDEDKEGMVPRLIPLRQTGPAGSLYQAVLGMIYPCWSSNVVMAPRWVPAC
jgi:hypothetical protein